MGNVNMESYQIHYKGEETAKTMFEKLDLIAQQVGDLPTFTSDDRAFLEKLPALPTVEGKTVLTAETDDQGETNLSYATPEVEGEDVAPEFSDAEAYSAGDLVFHDGILYRFTSDHSAGDWDATEATPTSVAGELSELKNTLITISDPITVSVGTVAAGNPYLIAYVSNLIPAGKTCLGGILVESGGSTSLIGGSIVVHENNVYFIPMSAQENTKVTYRVMYK